MAGLKILAILIALTVLKTYMSNGPKVHDLLIAGGVVIVLLCIYAIYRNYSQPVLYQTELPTEEVRPATTIYDHEPKG